MPTFKYTARDQRGKATAGAIDATDPNELRRMLRANDLYLIRFRGGAPATEEERAMMPSIFERKPKLQDLVIALRQLASMMRAGVPVMQVMEIVGSQTNKPALRRAFKELEHMVTEGMQISVGMRRHPKLFSPLVIALVEAGEVGGTLEASLDAAADQLDREDDLQRRTARAMFYPKLVLSAAVLTVVMMMMLVVPVFADVYASLHGTLPFATRLLIAISAFFVHYWWVILLGGGALMYGFRKYRESPGGRRRLDIIALKLPIFGKLLRKLAIARFVLTLAGAFKGGVGILRSLVISGETAGNIVIRDAVLTSAEHVRDGSTIAEELDKTGEFPLMVTRMVAAGEASGNLDSMLEEINRYYERDVKQAVNQITGLIEPAMTIIVGSIVLLILLALYMPVFKLGEAFRATQH